MNTYKAGTVVQLKDGRKINIKEHIKAGMYEGNDIINLKRVYFEKEEIVRKVSKNERDN